MHWTYADVEGLPQDVYAILVDLLNADAAERQQILDADAG